MTLLSRLFGQASSDVMQAHIQLLSRPGCHLCEDAFVALSSEFKPDCIDVVNVATNPDLEDRFVFRIPVVLSEGEVLAEGIIGRTEARQIRRKVDQSLRHGQPVK